MTIPIGSRVRCCHRGNREGIVLAKDDPRVWVETIAFPTQNPDPQKVREHVLYCLASGWLAEQPVLWQFDDHQHIYWSTQLIQMSWAVARQFPDALSHNWFIVTEMDGSNQRGPFIMTAAQVQEDWERQKLVTPYPQHDRPTVQLSAEQVAQRFPRLCAAICSSGYFTWNEATYIVRDYLWGQNPVWWGRDCARIIRDEIKAEERHKPYRKKGFYVRLQQYRPDVLVKQKETP